MDTAISWFDLDTKGTGSESGEPVGAERRADATVDLEVGGASTGAGVEL